MSIINRLENYSYEALKCSILLNMVSNTYKHTYVKKEQMGRLHRSHHLKQKESNQAILLMDHGGNASLYTVVCDQQKKMVTSGDTV